MALADLQMPEASAEESPEDKKKKIRKPWDETSQDEEGTPYEDIPGVEHDEVSGGLLEAPVTMAMAPAKSAMAAGDAGAGYISRMMSKGAPAILKPAAASAASALDTEATTAALKAASPEISQQIINSPSLMKRLQTEGTKVIQELEDAVKRGTRAVARGAIGARSSDQVQKVRSNPMPESRTLDYTGNMGPKWK